ncbi:MAG: hypothetical protein WC236_09690 [Gallionellaceae bacterium]|jgi:hypothetical protein
MTSKSELRRKCVVNPLDMADELHRVEQENASLQRQLEAGRVKVARLLDMLSRISKESAPDNPILNSGASDFEFLENELSTLQHLRGLADTALSESADNDAWMREQKAKVLEELACAFESNGADAMFAVDELRRMTAELRSAPAEATCKSCDGNDGDKPCAYPSEGKHGCLRDARMRTPESDDDQSIRIR